LKSSKNLVLVAGHTGMVGRAICRHLETKGINFVGISTKEADLRDFKSTLDVLNSYRPNIVIDAAARVGGIKYNSEKPVEFLQDNLAIQNNLLSASFTVGVERFVFLGSSCVYPKHSPQPIKESYLLSGPLEPTNSAYAIAKIADINLVDAYRRQYQKDWISLMPTNLYGPFDNFDLEKSHVVPALIRKFHDAIEKGFDIVEVWGSPETRREFMYVEDLADGIMFCLDNYHDIGQINIGVGSDVTIGHLVKLLSNLMGFSGKVIFNSSMPAGTPRKLLDISRLESLGWLAKTPLETGLQLTISWYLDNLKVKK
jgi:GDP-L-fucose synthase